jgi:MFS family permease
MGSSHDQSWEAYAATLKPHELPVLPGSPATPDHPPVLRLAYGLTGVLVTLTGSLGAAMVTANIQNLQGALGVSAIEAAWLPIVFVMTNACLGLMLVKFRQQYGLRLFTRIFLSALVVVSFAHIFIDSFGSALVVRAAAGMAAAGLSTLGFLYLIQAFPAHHRLKGLAVGIGASSYAIPIARIYAPGLLDLDGWRSFHIMELGLSLLSLAATFALRLPPSKRTKAFDPLDFLTFGLFAPGVALLAVVLGLGRLVWWADRPFIGWALAGAIVLLAGALVVEHNRKHPMISLGWMAGPEIIRLILCILLVRVVLSEQTSGAVGFLQQMGVGPDQLRGLFVVVLVATLAGSLISAFTVNPARLNVPIAVALGLIAIGAWMDSDATSLIRPQNLYISQALLAFAAALFIGPAMLIGVTQVRQQGPRFMVSFLVVFSVCQNIGGLAGSALVGTVELVRQRAHYTQLGEVLSGADPQVVQRLAQLSGAYGRAIVDPDRRAQAALQLFAQQLTQQSHVLAYNDVFRMISAAAGIGCVWVSLYHFRKRAAERRSEADAAEAAADAVAAGQD